MGFLIRANVPFKVLTIENKGIGWKGREGVNFFGPVWSMEGLGLQLKMIPPVAEDCYHPLSHEIFLIWIRWG